MMSGPGITPDGATFARSSSSGNSRHLFIVEAVKVDGHRLRQVAGDLGITLPRHRLHRTSLHLLPRFLLSTDLRDFPVKQFTDWRVLRKTFQTSL